MACFITPMSFAIVTTIFRRKIPENLKISWLNIMMWGGVIALAVEHIVHEEIVFFPPFLTTMQTPSEIPVMLKEMAIIGGTMTIAIAGIWLAMVFISKKVNHTIINPVKN